MAVILLFSFPPAQTFDYDALRRTFRNFKKHFSVRLLFDPHIPRFFCLSAGPATAHQDHRFLPLLLRPSCSRLWPLCLLTPVFALLTVSIMLFISSAGIISMRQFTKSCQSGSIKREKNCLLPQLSNSMVRQKGRCAVTYHQHERGFENFPRFLGLTCCLSPSTSKLSLPQSEGSLVFIVKLFCFA